MRHLALALAASSLTITGCADNSTSATEAAAENTQERNKRLAREFYENLWFTNNTQVYADYVADEYIVHDVGDRKGVTEAAIEQKNIADFFHSVSEMTGEFDYQIAEGDKVATRWFLISKSNERGIAMGMGDVDRVAIINVFRFNEEGKIVEIWNHRHDVDLPMPPARD